MRTQHLGLKLTAMGLFVAAAVGLLLFWLSQAGHPVVPGDHYRATVIVRDAVHLVPQSSVRQAGVKIGRVTAVDSRAPGRVAVEVELGRAYAPLRRDDRVLVGMRTLVGESYLDVQAGDRRAPAVPAGGTLPLAQAITSVQLDDILAAFDARTRRHIRAHLRQMGRGLGGRSRDLNRLLGAMRPTARDGAEVMAVLRHEREALGRLASGLGETMEAIGDRDRQLAVLASGVRRTSEAVAARAGALGATLDELPASLRQVRGTVGRLAATSRVATPVVADLRSAAGVLPAVLRDLGPAAREGTTLLAQLPPLARVGDPLLARLRTFSAAAAPLMGQTDETLRQLNPVVRYLAPYRRELGTFLAVTGASSDARDHVGQLGRVFPVLWQDSLAISPAQRQLLDRVLRLTGVKKLLDEQVNPYPRPGDLERPQRLTRAPEPPAADPPSRP